MSEQQQPSRNPRRGSKAKDFPLALNDEEHAELWRLKEETGAESRTALIKARTFDKQLPVEPRRIIHAADPVLLREVARIGNNINQLARAVNRAAKKGAIGAEITAPLLLALAIIAEATDELTDWRNVA